MTPKLDPKSGSRTGNYNTLFDSDDLGVLFSQVHAAMIRAGTELEKHVVKACADHCVILDDLDDFLKNRTGESGTFIATKKVVKKSETIKVTANEPDLIVFVNNGSKSCYVIELKWGTVFDTKKSDGEISALRSYRDAIGRSIAYVTHACICSFVSDDREAVRTGFKKKIDLSEVMQGTEFCSLLGINRDLILEKMRQDAEYNIAYVVDKMLEVDSMRSVLYRKIAARGDYDEAA